MEKRRGNQIDPVAIKRAAHEDRIRRTHAARRRGDISPERAAEIVQSCNRALRRIKGC